MNKGLEALNELYLSARDDEFGYNGRSREAQRTYEQKLYELKLDIEAALKRLETLEEEKQSFDTSLEKKLKALEIIKNKRVDVHYLFICFADQYNNGCSAYNRWKRENDNYYLEQEEYDLLKEVL